MKGEYDLLVLGGGPAGYPAAIRGAQLGGWETLARTQGVADQGAGPGDAGDVDARPRERGDKQA